jgi:hypothetical protein
VRLGLVKDQAEVIILDAEKAKLLCSHAFHWSKGEGLDKQSCSCNWLAPLGSSIHAYLHMPCGHRRIAVVRLNQQNHDSVAMQGSFSGGAAFGGPIVGFVQDSLLAVDNLLVNGVTNPTGAAFAALNTGAIRIGQKTTFSNNALGAEGSRGNVSSKIYAGPPLLNVLATFAGGTLEKSLPVTSPEATSTPFPTLQDPALLAIQQVRAVVRVAGLGTDCSSAAAALWCVLWLLATGRSTQSCRSALHHCECATCAMLAFTWLLHRLDVAAFCIVIVTCISWAAGCVLGMEAIDSLQVTSGCAKNMHVPQHSACCQAGKERTPASPCSLRSCC